MGNIFLVACLDVFSDTTISNSQITTFALVISFLALLLGLIFKLKTSGIFSSAKRTERIRKKQRMERRKENQMEEGEHLGREAWQGKRVLRIVFAW